MWAKAVASSPVACIAASLSSPPASLRVPVGVTILDILWCGDGLVPGPDPFVLSHGLAVAEGSHPGQVGDHFDPAAGHAGAHGVVVGVQPDVVIARNRVAARHPVAGATGGSVSIACLSAVIRSVGAQPNTRRVRVFTTSSH